MSSSSSSSSSSPSSSSSSSSSSHPLPSFRLPSTSSPFPPTPSSPSSSLSTSLTPRAYLARVQASPASANNEIWDAAHRLYLYLTLSSSSQVRASCFRRLVRLCLAHRDLLLSPVEAAVANAASTSASTTTPLPLQACPVCCTSYTAASRCCWFLPDQREQHFLNLLVALCRDHAAMFGDDVTPEKFLASFDWN